MILLVEDNPDDEASTLFALKKSSIRNVVFVVRDGAEALDFYFARVRMPTATRTTCLRSPCWISSYQKWMDWKCSAVSAQINALKCFLL